MVLVPRCAAVLAALFAALEGACTDISIADSTPLAVRRNLRIQRHSVFKGIAQRGKSSTSWFYGFKLHAAQVTIGARLLAMASSLFCKLCADKSYIGKAFAQKMKDKCIDLVTRVRKDMKEVMHSEFD